MAVEKWLDEQIAQGKSVKPAIDQMVIHGRSLAFAGLLTGIGKRHPKLFANELKRLLFHREIYTLDAHAVQQHFGDGGGILDGKIVREMLADWNALPGRRELLRDMCHRWAVTDEELMPTFADVSAACTAEADSLPSGSKDQIVARRWAWNFTRKNWKLRKRPDGSQGWATRLPDALRDKKSEVNDAIKMNLLTLPMRAGRWLEERAQSNDAGWRGVVKQLKDWAPLEQASEATPTEEDASVFRDHRHTKAAMVAMLLSLGADWLKRNTKHYRHQRTAVRPEYQKRRHHRRIWRGC